MAPSSYQLVTTLYILFLLVWLHGAPLEARSSSYNYEISKPGCSNKCGNISIPYPFGFGDESCNLDHVAFRVTCNETFDPPKPLISTLDLYDIDLIRGEVKLGFFIAYDCYNLAGAQRWNKSNAPSAWSGSFTFSHTRNKFFAVGCDTIAYYDGSSYTTGCMSFRKMEVASTSKLDAAMLLTTIKLSSIASPTNLRDLNDGRIPNIWSRNHFLQKITTGQRQLEH